VKRINADGTHTPAEKYMYSSIMDYDARFYADSYQGIGPYDRAAIKFGYGQLVEVFDKNIAPYDMSNLLFFNDYTAIPRLLSGELACDAALESHGANSDCPALQNRCSATTSTTAPRRRPPTC